MQLSVFGRALSRFFRDESFSYVKYATPYDFTVFFYSILTIDSSIQSTPSGWRAPCIYLRPYHARCRYFEACVVAYLAVPHFATGSEPSGGWEPLAVQDLPVNKLRSRRYRLRPSICRLRLDRDFAGLCVVFSNRTIAARVTPLLSRRGLSVPFAEPAA